MEKYLSEKSSNKTNKWKAANVSGAAQNKHLQIDQLKKTAHRSRIDHPFARFFTLTKPNHFRSQRTGQKRFYFRPAVEFLPAGFSLIAENRPKTG
jgi:hypothetical protein